MFNVSKFCSVSEYVKADGLVCMVALSAMHNYNHSSTLPDYRLGGWGNCPTPFNSPHPMLSVRSIILYSAVLIWHVVIYLSVYSKYPSKSIGGSLNLTLQTHYIALKKGTN